MEASTESSGPGVPADLAARLKTSKLSRMRQRLRNSLRHITDTNGRGPSLPFGLIPVVRHRRDSLDGEIAKPHADAAKTAPAVQLPIELWWMIIDYLSQHDWSALLACTAVCQAWHVRAQLYLPQGDGHAVGLPSRREVILLSRFSRVRALRTKAVHVYGDPHSRSLAHFGTFAAMLSGKLRQLEELHIVDGIWKVAALNIIILCRRLPTFTAIHRLRLRNVTLPSTTAFAHFICALPGLRTLECVNVTVSTTPKQRYGDSAALRILRDPPFELKKLILDCPDGDAIVDLFAMAGLARKSRSVWLSVYSVPHHDRNPDTGLTNYEKFVASLPPSLSQLTIIFHGSDLSQGGLVSFLSTTLQHCGNLKNLLIKIAPHVMDPADEVETLCAIPFLIAGTVDKMWITVETNSPSDDPGDESQAAEEVVWARIIPQASNDPPRLIIHVSIPSWAACKPGFQKDIWVERIKHYAIERDSDRIIKATSASAWVRFAGPPGRPRPYFVATYSPAALIFPATFALRWLVDPARLMSWRRTCILSCTEPVSRNIDTERKFTWFRWYHLKGTHTVIWAVEKERGQIE